MITTFFDEIRDMQAYSLENATPVSLSAQRFRRHTSEYEFESWAEQNPQACFRVFEIRDLFDYEEVLSTNGDVEPVNMRAEISIAYPKDRRYGEDGLRDMHDVAREDMLTFTKNCGFLSSGTTFPRYGASDDDWTFDDEGDAVSFLVIQYQLNYWEDVSGTFRDYVFDGNDPVTVDGAQVYI